MPANTTPIFTRLGDIQWAITVTTANTTTDLTTGTAYLAFAADATNGGYIQKIRFRTLGTNVATVARVWINNGAPTGGAAANNTLFDEISLAATTVSQVAATSIYELPMNIALPPNYKIYITLGTTVAAGYDVTVVGGKY
jgi:hypothetical protein